MMVKYDFSVLEVKPLKGHKIEGTKDYVTKVLVSKGEKVLYDGTIRVRKNMEGVFPDMDAIKTLPASLQKDLSKNLKEYIKKAK